MAVPCHIGTLETATTTGPPCNKIAFAKLRRAKGRLSINHMRIDGHLRRKMTSKHEFGGQNCRVFAITTTVQPVFCRKSDSAVGLASRSRRLVQRDPVAFCVFKMSNETVLSNADARHKSPAIVVVDGSQRWINSVHMKVHQ